MRHYIHLIFSIIFLSSISLFGQKSRQDVIKAIEGKSEQYSKAALQIWNFAEVGYKEEKSSALL